jgi:hypothetical protein
MRTILVGCALAFAAGCGGDDGGGAGADAANLPACTGVAYDSCTDTTAASDCTNGMTCRNFPNDGITICTPTCDASNPCPNDKDGNVVACNMMGRCKATPNACTP